MKICRKYSFAVQEIQTQIAKRKVISLQITTQCFKFEAMSIGNQNQYIKFAKIQIIRIYNIILLTISMEQISKFKNQHNNSSHINPYGVMDDDYGDEDLLLITLKENHPFSSQISFQEEIRNIENNDTFIGVNDFFPIEEESFQISSALDAFMDHERQLSQPRSHQNALDAFLINSASRWDHYMGAQVHQIYFQENTHQWCVSSQLPQQNCQFPANKQVHLEAARARLSAPTPKEKKVKKYKNDERKNMYGYSFKFIIKEFLSQKYQPLFERLCVKWGVTNKTEVKKFYQQTLKRFISLWELHEYLNYKQHEGSLRKVKQVFHDFYVRYMRKRYTIHILTEPKIIHKEKYLQAKNYLIYLPDLKLKSKLRVSSSKR